MSQIYKIKIYLIQHQNKGIKQNLNVNNSILNFLFKVRPKKIYISFDNDDSNAGKNAAERVKKKLLNHFDEEKIQIALASGKDFGEMSCEQIENWYIKIKS